MLDRQQCLRILGLSSAAGPDEIREAYRDLARVWHPDRFGDDARLRARAEAHLKEINEAYAYLLRPEPEPAMHHGFDPSVPVPRTVYDPFGRPPPTPAFRRRTPRLSTLATFLLAVVLVLIAVPFFTDRAAREGGEIGEASLIDPSQDRPARRARRQASASKAPAGEDGMVAEPAPVPASGEPHASAWFTVGSTKQEVLDIQGPPTRFDGDEWRYGNSRVTFRSGRVVRWDVWPGSPLKVRMDAGSAPMKAPGYITPGSTRDEVIAVLGTPEKLTDRVWTYGQSQLFLSDGRVTGWRIRPGSPLDVRLLPSSSVDRSLRRFTLGSTKDEVLVVQGTPTEFSDRVWKFGSSSVHFDEDLVTSWEEWPGSPLKVHEAGDR